MTRVRDRSPKGGDAKRLRLREPGPEGRRPTNPGAPDVCCASSAYLRELAGTAIWLAILITEGPVVGGPTNASYKLMKRLAD
jgi:hypothetical protein